MSVAQFVFLAELNDFLPKTQRNNPVQIAFEGTPAVKHLIESLGIPHTEVQWIVLADRPVDLTYLAADRDSFRVYPASVSPNGIRRLPGPARFVLDVHLGKLAAYLRMLGFDALYRNDTEDPELAQIAHDQQRILLTRDRRLLMRSLVEYGYCLRHLDPDKQLVEVIRRYHLLDEVGAFQRCLRCNGLLKEVSKEEVLDRLEPLTRQYYQEFHVCRDCGQVYWKGSHYKRMQAFIRHSIETSARN